MRLRARIAALAVSVRPAAAQSDYPSKPIKFVVPFAAGGGIDFTARATAQKLSEVIGQQVIVENQGGGGGTIGTNAVVRAAPDGYTLLYHSSTGVVSSVVGKDLAYDWLRDLAPVSLVTRFAPVLIINPSLPAKDLKEFIALAKANPGQIQLWLVRRRDGDPSRQRDVQGGRRRRHRACALSRQCRRHARPARGPHPDADRRRAAAAEEYRIRHRPRAGGDDAGRARRRCRTCRR